MRARPRWSSCAVQQQRYLGRSQHRGRRLESATASKSRAGQQTGADGGQRQVRARTPARRRRTRCQLSSPRNATEAERGGTTARGCRSRRAVVGCDAPLLGRSLDWVGWLRWWATDGSGWARPSRSRTRMARYGSLRWSAGECTNRSVCARWMRARARPASQRAGLETLFWRGNT